MHTHAHIIHTNACMPVCNVFEEECGESTGDVWPSSQGPGGCIHHGPANHETLCTTYENLLMLQPEELS